MVEGGMSAGTWSVAEAKAKLSEVIEEARTHGPQMILRNGKKAVVVVAAEEWERKTQRRGTLADFLSSAPVEGTALEVERIRDMPRDIDL